MRRLAAMPVAVLLVAVAAACSKSDETPSPFADCSSVTLAAAASTSTGSTDLPSVSLPCFTGGKMVALTSVRGPAVINFWASWCGPCRTELPVMQQFYADSKGADSKGRVTVFGVDTGDSREAGASFATDKKVTMPTLVDEDKKLFNALGGSALPMTVFIDSQGKRTVYPLPLDAKKLAEQVKAHS